MRIVFLNFRSRDSASGWVSHVLGCCLLVMVCSVASLAQAPFFGSNENAPDQTPRSLLGDQLIIMSFEQVGGMALPSESQFTASRMLLEQASQLLPDDANLWMMKAELARASGDMVAWAEAVKTYLRIEPEHDAVLYELLMYQASQQQTVADRVRQVERILTNAPRGSLSPALQSRLAIYLATAAREQDDRAMMLHWLRQAVKLDETNATAAGMMYDLLVEHGSSRENLDQALIRWLAAAPADPAVRLMVADRCFATGLYRRAAQQFDMAAQLSQGDVPPEVFQPWVTSLIASGQTRDALRLTYSLEASIMQSMPQPDIADAWPGDDTAQQAELDMPLSILMLRQIVAATDERVDSPSRNWERLVATDRKQAGENPTMLQEELSWFAAMYAPQIQQARELIEISDESKTSGQLGRLYLAIREGNRDEAMKWLGALKDSQVPAAELAVAMLVEDRDDRLRTLQKVASDNGGTLVGALAANMLQERGEVPSSTLDGAKLESQIRNLSRRMWFTDLEQEPWVILHVTVNRGRYNYLEPIVCEIRVNNNARAPLAIGSSRAIPDNGVLVVNASVNGRDVGRIPPIFFSTFTKLRLEPDDSLKTYVRLDRTMVGLMLSDNPALNFNLRVISVLAPKVLPSMAIVPMPTGMARRIHSVFRIGLNPTPALLNQWRTAASNRLDSVERFKSIARLCQLNPLPLGDQEPKETRPQSVRDLLVVESDNAGQQKVRRRLTEEERVVREAELRGMESVATMYADMDRLEQAWVVRFINRAEPGRAAPFEAIFESAAKSEEPLVRMTYLVTHAKTPDDPSLAAAMQSSNQTLKTFATALKQVILEREEAEAKAAAETQEQDTEQP